MQRHLTTFITRAVFCLGLLACDQGDDETCQINGDCSTNYCCIGAASERGYCTTEAICEDRGDVGDEPDAGMSLPLPDAGDSDPTDSGTDADASLDASLDDAGMSMPSDGDGG